MKARKPKIELTVIKGDIGYGVTGKWHDRFIETRGDTLEELKVMALNAVNLAFGDLGYTYTIHEIKFKYDLESFFDFYRVINVKALSERIGMNQSLLAQYIKGIKHPSATQTKRILDGVQQIGRELAEARFLL